VTIARNRRRAGRKTTPARALLLGLGLAGIAAPAVAAPIRPGQGYTMSPGARAVVLDQEGRRIAIPRAGGAFPEGTSPTYLAYRLGPRGQVPDGTPRVAIAPGPGGAGPLRLDAAALRSIDAGLAASSRVAVVGPRQSFLVESASPAGLGGGQVQYWRPGGPGDSGGKSIGKTIEGWYDSSTDAVKDLNDRIADALKKAFTPPAPKPVIIPPSRVAAQVIDDVRSSAEAEAAAESPAAQAVAVADDAQPAPVPEPAAWVVFAAASALGLRLRRRKVETA